ncbi:TPA: hypothetical protein I7251_08135 [Vibrio vulnificus]|nr:hypothetical protein [Vibrio vulnificus]HAS6422096.1 hypothetical protein [Vibrio vulnificus]
MAIEARPQKHLLNILRTTHNPNFTLFLGAGASVTSGVRHAGNLIDEWRDTYSDMYPTKKIEDEHWYNTATEYSELFELLYDQPSQRREFIESCVKDALPSWGYIYLANLLKHNVFNTVFTTNFDDLINEACYSFSSDLKPLVSAHDSSISSVRLTSPRPKIIKLHGDFLFDNIKNTVRELESLEDNMRSKFRQYASEFGMIVIGYSGNDRSIMETLNTLLRYDNNFPHGIYWCVRKGADLNKLSKDLEELTRFPRFHLIEIDGFDECLADIHNCLNLELQDEVSAPYRHLATRLDNFVSRNGSDDDEEHPHYVINADINKLKNNLQQVQHAIEIVDKVEQFVGMLKDDERTELTEVFKQLSEELKPFKAQTTDELHLISTPNTLLAGFEYRDENYDKSSELAKRSLESRTTIEAFTLFVKSLAKTGKMSDFPWAFKKLKSIKKVKPIQGDRLISAAVDLIGHEHFDFAVEILDYLESIPGSSSSDAFIRLNRALIIKLQNKELPEDLAIEIQQDLADAIENSDNWLTFGLSLILDKEEAAFQAATHLDRDQILIAINKDMPIMNLISDPLYERLESLEQVQYLPDIDTEKVVDDALLEEGNCVEAPKTVQQDSTAQFESKLHSDDSNVVNMKVDIK